MIQDKLNQLIETVSQYTDSEEIFNVKQEYLKKTGEVYEDDKSYENRMALFLEWCVLDRITPGKNATPLETILEESKGNPTPEERKIYQAYSDNISGIFLVKKIRDISITILNLFDNLKYTVHEPEGGHLFKKGDLFQGRLIQLDDKNYFTGNFFFHPPTTIKFIKSEIQKVKIYLDDFQIELRTLDKKLVVLKKKHAELKLDREKTDAKISRNSSENKIQKLKARAEVLNIDISALENEISGMENDKEDLLTLKIKIEGRQIRNNMIHKLSYMNLKWERSRQIDLHDIYRTDA